MFREARKVLVLASAGLLGMVMGVSPALAVDSPKWVAAVYVEAQKVIGLRWQPVAAATGYKVLRSTTKGADYKEVAAPTAPQYLDKDIEGGETYYYVLQAVAGADVSANSDEKSVTTPGEKKAMASPTWENLTLQVTTEFGKQTYKVGLFWKGSPSALAYNIYRSTEAGKGHQLLTSTQDLKIVDDKVEPGKTYYYYLTALDASFMETPPSAEKSMEVKAPEKKVEKGKKVAKSPALVIQPTKEIGRIEAGLDDALSAPVDTVIASNGDLYVLNGAAFVSVFSPEGEFKFRFGERGQGEDQMIKGFAIGIDREDTIYCCDGSKILVFEPDGKFVKAMTLPLPKEEDIIEAYKKGTGVTDLANERTGPFDLAETKDGKLAVTDNTFGRVVIIEKSGEFVTSFGMYGTAEGMFKRPSLIAVNQEGEIFVNDNMNRRAQIWGPDYQFKMIVGESKTFVGAFLGLYGAAADDKGNFIVSDPPMAAVQVFDRETGDYLYHFGDEQKRVDPESKNQRPLLNIGNPTGISYNKSRRYLYVPLTQANQVVIWQVL